MEPEAKANSNISTNETIATRLTAEVPAAIATLAIKGFQAAGIVARHVQLDEHSLQVGRVRYGQWQLSSAIQQPAALQATLDQRTSFAEQVVICRIDDETFEVHCHGGTAVCQAILSDLEEAGCTIVSQAAWPSKLKCSIARAAEQDLLLATTDRAAAILLDQMQGALQTAIAEVIDKLNRGEPRMAESQLHDLLRWGELGLHLAHPWKVVLAGPPNVGKSSLMNALVGTQQSIVHAAPGTTRDWIESSGAVDGWPVRLTDTAGVRETDEPIERAGVERSKARLRDCDLTILVVDAQQGWTETHEHLLHLSPRQLLVVINKIDLVEHDSHSHGSRIPSLEALQVPIVCTCALDPSRMPTVLKAISDRLFPECPPARCPVPFRLEHIELLKTCVQMVQHCQYTQAEQLLTEWIA